MKNLILATVVLISCLTFGQKKIAKKESVPPIVKPAPLEPPPVNRPVEAVNTCYSYTSEEKKDSLVYNTKTLVEYGASSIRARVIITKTNYDPVKKLETEKDGRIYGQPSKMQYIEGKYTVENNTLHFTPDKLDKYEKRTFKLVKKAKSKTLDHIEDENNNILKKGKCPEPIISL